MRRFTTFDGLQIAYDVLGDGALERPVLLHHGFASDSRTNWVRPGVAGAIVESGRQVVLIDARGHGDSDKPHDPASYEGSAMAHDVRAMLDLLGVNEVDLIGYSMGSFVSLAVATAQPPESRLRSLVLGGAGWGQVTFRAERRLAIADALLADDKSTITDPSALAFRNFAEATGADRAALAAVQRARTVHPVPSLSLISVPTLVLNGERDTLVGAPASLAEAIPGARFEVVPGDHISAVVKPEFRQAIVRWLDSLREG